MTSPLPVLHSERHTEKCSNSTVVCRGRGVSEKAICFRVVGISVDKPRFQRYKCRMFENESGGVTARPPYFMKGMSHKNCKYGLPQLHGTGTKCKQFMCKTSYMHINNGSV